ncbi:MAG: sulfite exporter TauE/SafE family protein [Alphaproteobacteria bacterium]|nr:sulfite exporter TauE/SafE family protein [Alphaproteobacteria bacterium]
MTEDLALAGLIFLAATLYSSVGHAGASGYLAAMALVGLAPEAMRPAALALNILVATIATLRYARAGYFSWRTFLPFALASTPFAFVGGWIELPSSVYRPVVGGMLLIAAGELARSARKAPESTRDRHPPPLAAAAIGAAIGLLAGLTGTGGGIFLSPVLLLAGWTATRNASGVAAAFILCNSVAGLLGATVSWATLPEALPLWLATAAAGGLIGTQLGIRALPVFALRYALAAVLVIAAAKLVFW